MSSTLIWYTARASGIVSLVLLSASVLFGLSMRTRLLETRFRLAWLQDLHRFFGASALVFVGVHVSAIFFDSYVQFGPVEVLVPFSGTWHPVAVAWGIVAFYLLLAVEITSLLRRRLPLAVWRRLHYLSFPLFALVVVHALTAGTDSRSLPLRATYAAIVAACLALGLTRIKQGEGATSEALTPALKRTSER